jgi:hypothetical protein
MERPTILIDARYEEEVSECTPWASGWDDDDDARSFFSVDDVEKPGDVIPRQSIFLARTLELIQAADAVEDESRGAAIMTLMEHLLRSEYAPFHRAYPVWRRVANERCAAFLEEATEAALRDQCCRFIALFPA